MSQALALSFKLFLFPLLLWNYLSTTIYFLMDLGLLKIGQTGSFPVHLRFTPKYIYTKFLMEVELCSFSHKVAVNTKNAENTKSIFPTDRRLTL